MIWKEERSEVRQEGSELEDWETVEDSLSEWKNEWLININFLFAYYFIMC